MKPTHVVGVGASAGGLEALFQFFGSIPTTTPMAFVVVQHLSPDFKSEMPDLLRRRTSLPVVVAADGIALKGGTIYLNSAKSDLTVEDGLLRQHPWEEGGLHHPINVLFESLSHKDAERSICVILSGSGSDGAEGCRAVHKGGGLIIVQDDASSQFDGMPLAAARTGIANFVVEPHEMGPVLERHALDPYPTTYDSTKVAELDDPFSVIYALLHERYNINFALYKPSTVSRRIRRRAEFAELDISSYSLRLDHDNDELDALYWDLLIGVTEFFRDKDAFEALEREVIAPLASRAPGAAPVRIWVTGCASGEEAYSIAMLMAEAQGGCNGFQIFATDAHPGSLRKASLGVYPKAEEQVPKPLLEKYFEHHREGWQVSNELRQTIVFAPHELISDPPFSRVDLVTCRNLLIYLGPSAQNQVIERLGFSLTKGGVMFLGPSETLGPLHADYETIDRRWKLFRKLRNSRQSVASSLLALPAVSRLPSPPEASSPSPKILAAYDQILARFAPAGFLIDTDRTLLHTFGNANEYLQAPSGRATSDLTGMLVPELRAPVGSAIHRVLDDKQPVQITCSVGSLSHSVRVDFLKLGDYRSGCVLLTFGDAPTTIPEPANVLRSEGRTGQADRVSELEQELLWTRETLQSTMQAADVTNEELVASNEELQSTNEELQSVNEELHTVNSEYQEKNVELRQLSGDLEQLLRSTEIGVVFLDEEARVRRYTDAATRFVNLKQQDIGRPLGDLTNSFEGIDLLEIASNVTTSGNGYEEHADVGGTTQLVRAMPYLDITGVRRGVVLSFVDVTEMSRTQQLLKESSENLRLIIDSIPSNIAHIDENFSVQWVNQGAATAFGTTVEEAVGKPLSNFDPVAFTGRKPMYERALAGEDVEMRAVKFKDKFFDVNYRGLTLSGVPTSFLAIATDSTERVKQLAQLEADVRILDAVPVGVLIVRHEGDPANPRSWKLESANTEAKQLLGAATQIRSQMPMNELMPNYDGAGFLELYNLALKTETKQFAELSYSDATAPENIWRVRVEKLEEARVVMVFEDVGDEVRGRQQRLATLRLEAVGQIAGGVAHDLNNMLGAILMTTRTVRAELPETSDHHEDVDAIVGLTNRAADLVARLLDFSRQRVITPKVVSAGDLVTSATSMLKRVLGVDVNLDVNVDINTPIFIDPQVLEQALVNLATNARFAMPNGGEFTVATRIERNPKLPNENLEGQFVVIVAGDTGTGMDAATLERCFEPFFTTRPPGVGSGMGLAMVHGVVKQANGSVLAESSKHGTSISIYLPFHTDVEVKDPPVISAAPYRVLLVDDEQLLRRATAKSLRRSGYDIVEASNGTEALEILETKDFDVLVTDVLMPGMNGPTLAQKVRESRGDFPVVFISGYSAHAAVRSELWDGAEYLPKPFTLEKLVEAMERARSVCADTIAKGDASGDASDDENHDAKKTEAPPVDA